MIEWLDANPLFPVLIAVVFTAVYVCSSKKNRKVMQLLIAYIIIAGLIGFIIGYLLPDVVARVKKALK